MTISPDCSVLVARHATSADDLAICAQLRRSRFRQDASDDLDVFDQSVGHMLIEIADRPVGTFRYQTHSSFAAIGASYTAEHYDLCALTHLRGGVFEFGRLCLLETATDVDALRIAWGTITRLVDHLNARWIIGCTTLPGTVPAAYANALRQLGQHQVLWDVSARGGYSIGLAGVQGDGRQPLPPILRGYLGLGALVGKDLVVDTDLGTMHVFTCLDRLNVPVARTKALRSLAKQVRLKG